jgi:hypothetical protein
VNRLRPTDPLANLVRWRTVLASEIALALAAELAFALEFAPPRAPLALGAA